MNFQSRPGTSMASVLSSTIIEHPEAGNSNQSSSASTISAGSTADNGSGNGHSQNTTITGVGSPSPRKRPRKQQLSELTSSRAYGSDDDTSTPVVSYHCEAVEEETVMGPTGIGGMDGRYMPLTPPPRSQRGQGSLFLPTVSGDLYDQYHSPQRKQMEKAEYSSPSSLFVSAILKSSLTILFYVFAF